MIWKIPEDGKNISRDYIPTVAEHVEDEMRALDWDPVILSVATGLTEQEIGEILGGKDITRHEAECLGIGFGNGEEFWLNLQARLKKLREQQCDALVDPRD